ncbi:MAG TPA: hypothetical protein VM095_13585 [Pyrinomonadaceae bacterium]|nr:hypothetical protein [Pyrinomonadaceae bacterium]
MKLCPECQHCYEGTTTVCPEDQTPLTEGRAGTRLIAGNYRLDQFLGRGDIGTAYTAADVRTEKHVIAVELVRDDVVADREAMRRFHEAAKAAGRNNDQEIGRIFEHGPLEGGGAYVVMELLGADNEPKEEDTQSTIAPTDMQSLEMKRPSISTGSLDARRARAPRLAGIAKELTQEIPRINLPLSPKEMPPAYHAGTDVTAVEIIKDEQKAPDSNTQSIAPSNPTNVVAGLQPPPHIPAIPYKSAGRRRPLFLYLGLVLLLALVLLWFGLRRAPEAAPDRSSAQRETSTQGAADTQLQRTGADVNAEKTFSAPAAESPASESKDNAGMTTDSSHGSTQSTDPRLAVSGVLDEWLSALVNQDAEKFMSYYMPQLDTFYNRKNVRFSALRPDIVRFFERAGRVDARMIGEPRINFTDGDRVANVRFRLSYSIEGKGNSRRRGDGTQELRLALTEAGWKIESHRGEKLIG